MRLIIACSKPLAVSCEKDGADSVSYDAGKFLVSTHPGPG